MAAVGIFVCTRLLAAAPASGLSIGSSELRVLDRSLDRFTIEHGASVVEVDLEDDDDEAGISWEVAGVEHLAQEWFWFRLDDSKDDPDDDDDEGRDDDWDDDETSPLEIDHLRAHEPSGENGLTLTFAPRRGLGIEIDLMLTDMSDELPDAVLSETVTIRNRTGRELRFFEFTDWELLGTAPDELASVHFPMAGETTIVQKDGDVVSTKKVLAASTAQPESYALGVDGEVLDLLEDGGPFSETTSRLVIATRDHEWGLQWTVPDGSTLTIQQTKVLTPEPGTLALVALGLLGLVARQRVRTPL